MHVFTSRRRGNVKFKERVEITTNNIWYKSDEENQLTKDMVLWDISKSD